MAVSNMYVSELMPHHYRAASNGLQLAMRGYVLLPEAILFNVLLKTSGPMLCLVPWLLLCLPYALALCLTVPETLGKEPGEAFSGLVPAELGLQEEARPILASGAKAASSYRSLSTKPSDSSVTC